ncbi:YbfB/YjiJ family MFS transporter, partial [Pseudomonadales bacterium]|nr:YbfB/YjiJ family MFS transporter [Pseudomonadales bacterium]
MTSPQLNQPKTRLIQAGWVTVILVALSAAVGQAFGRFSYGVLLPAVRDDLGITNTLAGLIGAANVGAYLLGTLMVAWATSHYRLINVMRVGLILATLGLLLASLSSSPWLLAMALFVAGIGGAFLWIPAPVIAADALPPHRRRIAVGLMSSGIGLGVMFVSILS